METAPLKSFATWARTALIREVTARTAAVLAPGSAERIEQGKAVAALEKAVTAAGGGDEGRAAVADKVAYTWFNRIIALRFMDANGYTGIGVVSPHPGVDAGQPEILAEAKRGVIDTDVASQPTRSAVAGLLDGTRASGDPQGEAYALLLAEYCRYWNRAMPFMFERESDLTELLIPANLLADDSVLNRSVTVLTQAACKDVEVIGWLYQFYISELKSEVFAGFKNNKKAGADEIPAATQLFTPHWIVRYLVENSLGRLWMLNRPSSGLVNQMQYYVPPGDEETDFLKITKPEELWIIDPACGSGHMLTYAFDLLYAIYEEEGYGSADIPRLILEHNLHGAEIDPRAGALAAFALTMKARAKQRTLFGRQVEPKICVLRPISFDPEELAFLAAKGGDKRAEKTFWNQFSGADTVGSLIQPNADLTGRLSRHLATLHDGGDILRADTLDRAARALRQAKLLTPRYAVAVANPPYMGSQNMSPRLAAFASAEYPASKSDLYSMFMERNQNLVLNGGIVAMITMQSWMFIKSFAKLRGRLLREAYIQSLVHLGTGAFETISGEVVSTVAWCMTGRKSAGPSTFISATAPRGEAKAVVVREVARGGEQDLYRIYQSRLAALPGSPIAFWLGDLVLQAFENRPSVGSRYEIKVGMQTSDNAKFLRQWWEIGASTIAVVVEEKPEWVWYAKGGPFRRWTGNLDTVLHYNKDPGYVLAQPNATILPIGTLATPKVTWTHMSPGRVSFRLLPPQTFHDIGSHAVYLRERDALALLAYLNTDFVGDLIQALNPTVNIQTSDVARIPLFDRANEVLAELAAEAVKISRSDELTQEVHFEFERPPCISGTDLSAAVERQHEHWAHNAARLREIEDSLEAMVAQMTGVERQEGVKPVVLHNAAGVSGVEWARRQVVDLVSYAVGCMFGRYSLDQPGLILADKAATVEQYLAKVPTPILPPDADNVIPIVDGDWFDDDILERFRQFLRAAFGEQHFEQNLQFVAQALGVKNVRDYFVKSFYKDHVRRYKKRPIYWLFSSPKGSFNALVYMHRYSPSTASIVLNEYLREFQAKLKASLQHAERFNNAKEGDRLRKILLELETYEHDVLYPLASRNVAIDLDDGVRMNYPKLGVSLKKVVGLEASE